MQTNSFKPRTEASNPAAYHIAKHGLGTVFESANRFITRQVQTIDAVNQPVIVFFQTKLDIIFREWEALRLQYSELAQTHEPRDLVSDVWNVTVFTFSIGASWALTKMTMMLFQNIGVHADLYSAGMAIGLPWAVDRFLRYFRAQRLIKVLTIITLVSALSTGLMFALIRGQEMAHKLNVEPTVVIEDSRNSSPPADDPSGKEAVFLLRLSMVFAAIFFELVGGQAFHEFREGRRKEDPGRLRRIQKAQLQKEREYLEVLKALQEKLGEAQAFENEYWIQFDRGLIDAKRSRVS